MHRFHPDPDRPDPELAVLYDDCSSCDKAAEHPIYHLDDDRIRLLWGTLKAAELEDGHYLGRSDNDRKAVMKLWPFYLLCQRQPDLVSEMVDEATERSARVREARRG